MMTEKIKLFVYLSFGLLVASMLFGCGTEDGNDNGTLWPSNVQTTVSASDATFSTGFSEAYAVDLSSKVFSSDDSGFVLTDVEVLSDNENCQVKSLSNSGFVIGASSSKACNYRYSVAPREDNITSQVAQESKLISDDSSSVAVVRVAVSSNPNTVELTPVSDTTLINTGKSVNIETKLAEVGIALASGFELTDIILPYGYSSIAEVEPTNDRIINYTPAPSMTGIDRILYTYEDSSKGLVVMGVLDIAVGYEANQGFSIQDKPVYSDKVYINTPIDIDISDYVTSDDGDDYQLVYVASFNAAVSAKNPTDINNKIIEFESTSVGAKYVSFGVSDHNGVYDMGLLSVAVFDPDQSAQWTGVSYKFDYYTAPLTATDAVTQDIIYDSLIKDSGYSPAVNMAAFHYSTGESYCSKLGASVPTVKQLEEMTADNELQAVHNWPVQARYVAFDDVAGEPAWIDLNDGIVDSGLEDTLSTYYTTCVKQGVMEVLPSSSTEVVADGINTGSIFVQVKRGSTPWPDTLVTVSSDSSYVSLDSDSVMTDSKGIAEFTVTSLKAESVTLTFDMGGLTEDYIVKFIGDETTARVESETTVDHSDYYSSEGNEVTAKLIDQNDNIVEGYFVEFGVSSETHPDTGDTVTPILVPSSTGTDSKGEQKVRVIWDPVNDPSETLMTFDVNASYTTTSGTTSTDTSVVTFSPYLCGGLNDTSTSAAGNCVKAIHESGFIITASPSMEFVSANGIGNNGEADYDDNFAVFTNNNHMYMCDKFNTLKIAGRTNWNRTVRSRLASLYASHGDMGYAYRWPTIEYYQYGNDLINIANGREISKGTTSSYTFFGSCQSKD